MSKMPKTSEVLQRLTEIGTAELVQQLELPPDQASVVMREVAHLFAQEFGGTDPYISKDLAYKLVPRDLQIFQRMERGGSTLDIARDHNLTPRQVQLITRRLREQQRAAGNGRQAAFPGFDGDK